MFDIDLSHSNEIHFLAIKEVFNTWQVTFDLTLGMAWHWTRHADVDSNVTSNTSFKQKHLPLEQNSSCLNEILLVRTKKNATTCTCISKFGITYVWNTRSAHMTPLWNGLFLAYVVVTHIRLVRVILLDQKAAFPPS